MESQVESGLSSQNSSHILSVESGPCRQPIGPVMREGEGELAPAGIPLAVADVLQHPEPVRTHVEREGGSCILEPEYTRVEEK